MNRGLRILQITAGIFGFVIMFAAIYGLRFSHFVPSPLGVVIAVIAATVCGINGCVMGLKPPKAYPGRVDRKWLRSKWTRVPALAVITFGFGYWGFSAGLPAWYTAAFGTDGEQLGTVTDWRRRSLWACAGPDIAEAPMLSTVCLSYQDSPMAPVGTTLVLHGPITVLGVNVRSVSIK
jgi:hypothetical protein